MLPSEIDTEQDADIQRSNKLTTGRMPVMTKRAETLTTGRMPVVVKRAETLTTGRMPVVIPGAGKRVPQKVSKSPVKTEHRVLLHAAVVFVLGLFIFTTLVAVLPLGKEGQALGVGGLLQKLGVMSLVNANSNNSALVGAQAATATAIMAQDGYDPGSSVSQQYNASLGMSGSGNNFPYGQCTWWAAQRYHDLTGFWTAWGGNAYQWAAGAAAAGWNVSYQPHVPSIMVFQPGVQYANTVYGHVSIVESINADGTLTTSNMNVIGHPFGAVVDETNTVGPGVSFVWHS